MTRPLSVLIVEDSEDDMTLIVRALQRGGYDLAYERVDTAAAMSTALDRGAWDVVIADHSMPRFSAPAALALLKDRGFELPFIIVSGAIGEDIAVSAMKAGAQDYIMKGNLARLAPAIERELREAADRRERQRAETALSESEQRFRAMADTAPVLIWMAGPDRLYHYFNQRWLEFTGRTLEHEHGYGWMEGLHRDDFQRCFDAHLAAFDRRSSFTLEYRLRRADGQYRWILESAVPRYAPDGDFVGYIGSGIDISERKQAEAAIELHASQQAAVADLGQRALEGADPGTLMDEALAHIVALLDVQHCKIVEQLPGDGALRVRAGVGWHNDLDDQASPGAAPMSQSGYTLLVGQPVILENLATETRFSDSFLRRHHVVSGVSVVIHGHERPFGVLSAHATWRRRFSTDDIHFLQSIAHVLAMAIERRRADAALAASEARLAGIISSAMDAIVTIGDDQRITLFNTAAERMFHYAAADMLGQPIDRLIPERYRAQHRGYIHSYGETRQTRRHMRELGVIRGLRADGEEFPIEASISLSEVGGVRLFTVIMRDISARLRRERALDAVTALAAALPALIADRVSEALDADSVALAWRSSPGDMVIRAARGQWAASIGARLPLTERTNEASPSANAGLGGASLARPPLPEGDASAAPRAAASLPLYVAGEANGVLWIGRDSEIAEDDLRLLTTIADLAAVALDNADLRGRLDQDAGGQPSDCAATVGDSARMDLGRPHPSHGGKYGRSPH